jgi:5-methylcytosine-specific restriction enzyme subunit McrC
MIELPTLREAGRPETVALDDEVGYGLVESGVVTAVRLGPGLWEVAAGDKVGVAIVGDVVVRIRPKVPIGHLLFLLGYSRSPDAWRLESVPMATTDELVPALAAAFVGQAERALETGVLQGYVETEDELAVLRGRVREQEQLSRRFGLAVPLLVRYDDHSTDIAENQLLLAAASRLLRISDVPPQIRSRLRRLRGALADVSPLPGGAPLPRWLPTRLNARYHVALTLAEVVLSNRSLDIAAGPRFASGFLIDMIKVFEDFVTVALRQALTRHFGGRCTAQDTSRSLDLGRLVSLRPDLVWYRDGQPAAVVDAKYKAEKPQGFPQADVYQLLAYCVGFELAHGHLVYAKGNEPQLSHVVPNAGVTIHAQALDLAASPLELLGGVKDLAISIAACAGLPAPVGQA